MSPSRSCRLAEEEEVRGTDTDRIKIGSISGAFGLKGEIKLFHDSGERERIAGIEELFLCPKGSPGDGGGRPCRVLQMRYSGKTPILRIEGVDDRVAAEALIGMDAYVAQAALAPLAEGEWYVKDLLGVAVRDVQRGGLGTVAGILDNPAHDVLRIAPGDGEKEILLPMVDAFVLAVSPGAGEIVVRLPEGLIDGD